MDVIDGFFSTDKVHNSVIFAHYFFWLIDHIEGLSTPSKSKVC